MLQAPSFSRSSAARCRRDSSRRSFNLCDFPFGRIRLLSLLPSLPVRQFLWQKRESPTSLSCPQRSFLSPFSPAIICSCRCWLSSSHVCKSPAGNGPGSQSWIILSLPSLKATLYILSRLIVLNSSSLTEQLLKLNKGHNSSDPLIDPRKLPRFGMRT